MGRFAKRKRKEAINRMLINTLEEQSKKFNRDIKAHYNQFLKDNDMYNEYTKDNYNTILFKLLSLEKSLQENINDYNKLLFRKDIKEKEQSESDVLMDNVKKDLENSIEICKLNINQIYNVLCPICLINWNDDDYNEIICNSTDIELDQPDSIIYKKLNSSRKEFETYFNFTNKIKSYLNKYYLESNNCEENLNKISKEIRDRFFSFIINKDVDKYYIFISTILTLINLGYAISKLNDKESIRAICNEGNQNLIERFYSRLLVISSGDLIRKRSDENVI